MKLNSFKKIGKTPGKDKKQGKSTLLRLIGKNKLLIFVKKKFNNFKEK